QDLAVHLPEGGAARDARLVDELGAVVLPRGAPGGQDELQRGIETLGAREYALELGGVETMALDQLTDETLHFRPLIERLRERLGRRRVGCDREREQDGECAHASRSSRTRRR